VCKYYQGSEDKAFENKLKIMFAKVHREKPESSRSVSQDNLRTPDTEANKSIIRNQEKLISLH
jgi:21S rRNA (uridine2791-2'-O)-methyltransferase